LTGVFCTVGGTLVKIHFADVEMKFGMIVYNNELQIKYEFRRYWSIFDRVMALGLSHISEFKFAAGVFYSY
jgi:hypothetical protein